MPPKGTTEARAMMREKGKQRGEKREREYVYAFENKGNGPLEVFWI